MALLRLQVAASLYFYLHRNAFQLTARAGVWDHSWPLALAPPGGAAAGAGSLGFSSSLPFGLPRVAHRATPSATCLLLRVAIALRAVLYTCTFEQRTPGKCSMSLLAGSMVF